MGYQMARPEPQSAAQVPLETKVAKEEGGCYTGEGAERGEGGEGGRRVACCSEATPPATPAAARARRTSRWRRQAPEA
jgi:hypothetical protein